MANQQPRPAALPALCPSGHLFEAAGAIALGAGARVVVKGCTTRCPECGGLASIIDGNYTGTEVGGVAVAVRKMEESELRDLASRLQEQTAPERLAEIKQHEPLRRILHGLTGDAALHVVELIIRVIQIVSGLHW